MPRITYTEKRFNARHREIIDNANLITAEMRAIIDPEAWAESERERDEGRRHLTNVAENWDAVTEWLEERGDDE